MNLVKTGLILFTALLTLSACESTQSQYVWGNYERTLFAHYQDSSARERELKNYLAFMATAPAAPRKFAPGLLAEAGTFMLEQGNTQEAIRFYALEARYWPQSEALMNTLIETLSAQRVQESEANVR